MNAIEDGSDTVVVNMPVAADEWRLSIKRDIIVMLILVRWKALVKVAPRERKQNYVPACECR